MYDPSMSEVHVKNGFLNLRQERDSELSLLTPSGKAKHMQFFGLVKWWSPKKMSCHLPKTQNKVLVYKPVVRLSGSATF